MNHSITVAGIPASGARTAPPAHRPPRAWPILAAITAALAVLPVAFQGGGALTLFASICITIVFTLSFNILLGQSGMLSFGHAVYYGLGAFAAAHAMNWLARDGIGIPLPLIPLFGGLGGLAAGALFGAVSVRRGGTSFSMISVGVAELVGALVLILKSVFGGEAGITVDRTTLAPFLGFSFGSQKEVCFLMGAWCLACVVVMYVLSLTPLGKAFNAVRENPQRMQFLGYHPVVVRFLAFCFASLFAGIAGGMATICFEIANAQLMSASSSSLVLLAAYVGGASHFFGPVVGAVIVPVLQTYLSDYTKVWLLYFGALFIVLVLYAPGGLASLWQMHGRLRFGRGLAQLLPVYAVWLLSLSFALCGAIVLVELIQHSFDKAAGAQPVRLFGVFFFTASSISWGMAIVATTVGIAGLRLLRNMLADAWHRASAAPTITGAVHD